jgi:hypothetical protein
VYYEHFLYTRTATRDYTAFVRPEHTSDNDVTLLAELINHVSDVTWLTRWHPALYCFPMGDAIYLLRHYHSGIHHEGTPISVLEGIAAPRGSTRDFAAHLHRIVALQHDYLNVVGTVAQLDDQDTRISTQHSLRITRVQPPTPAPLDMQTIETMAQHEPDVCLYVPFTEKGSQLLVSVLSSPIIPPLVRFAHGTTSNGVRYLNEIGITLDVIGYFGLSRPSLRQRSNDRLIAALDGYARRAFIPPEPIANPEEMETVPSSSGPRYRETPSGERVPITTPTVPAEASQKAAVGTRPEDNLTVAQPTPGEDSTDGWINSLAKRIFRRDE